MKTNKGVAHWESKNLASRTGGGRRGEAPEWETVGLQWGTNLLREAQSHEETLTVSRTRDFFYLLYLLKSLVLDIGWVIIGFLLQ